MERCATHGFLNCKCTETLSAYLARQFREAGNGCVHVDSGKLGASALDVADLGDRLFRRGDVGREAKIR